MLDRKADSEQPTGPKLLDRVIENGARRVAILGLHPRAGTRTVLAALVRELHRRNLPYGVTSFPRPHLEQDEIAREPVTRIALPAGTYIASAADGAREEGVELETVESTRFESPQGAVTLYRVVRGGEIELCGPGSPEEMGATLSRLADVSGGPALVDGGWRGRSFAAPGVTDGVLLVLGAGYSATPERSAGAVGYVVETFSAHECSRPARVAWKEAVSLNAAILLDGRGKRIGTMPLIVEDPLPSLESSGGSRIASVVLPHSLNDELLAPLVRSRLRYCLVVRDATRINVAPIYFKAWLKSGGRIEVVHSQRLIGLATNPVNFSGQDANPSTFRDLVDEALPELPIHDVVLESEEPTRRPVWKFWE